MYRAIWKTITDPLLYECLSYSKAMSHGQTMVLRNVSSSSCRGVSLISVVFLSFFIFWFLSDFFCGF